MSLETLAHLAEAVKAKSDLVVGETINTRALSVVTRTTHGRSRETLLQLSVKQHRAASNDLGVAEVDDDQSGSPQEGDTGDTPVPHSAINGFNPTLRQLQAFLQVSEAHSYGAAARRLNGDAANLLREVKRLEKACGFALVEKIQPHPTAAGRALLPYIREVIGATTKLARTVADAREGRVSLTLGCYPVHAQLLKYLRQKFRNREPKAEIVVPALHDEWRKQGGRSLLDMLTAGEVDAVLAAGGSDQKGILSAKLYDWELTIVLPPAHPLRRKKKIRVTDLAGETLLVTPEGFRSRSLLHDACHAAGIDIRVGAESSSVAALLDLAEDGTGIAVVADDAIRRGWEDWYRVLHDEKGHRTIRGWAEIYWREGEADVSEVVHLVAAACEAGAQWKGERDKEKEKGGEHLVFPLPIEVFAPDVG